MDCASVGGVSVFLDDGLRMELNSGHSNNHSVADKIVVRTDPSIDGLPALDLQHWYTVSSDERADRAVEVSLNL
jgi:hypothetical protein